MYKGLIERYQDRLPITANSKIISLMEGNTPLIQLSNLQKSLNIDVELYAKFEGLNPTGSFKDRGMCVAVTKAVEKGSQAVICASTGNTSASAAAYAARAGLKCLVLIPEGKIALGKLAQAMMHGALVIQIDGNFDLGLDLVKQLAQELPLEIVNSINPYRLQGQKTAAFEVCEQLEAAPDYHCLPVGNAGNISAYWMGYTEYFNEGMITHRPKMLGYQASGAAPFIHGHPIEHPETIATAIRIGNPQSWALAHDAQQSSQGWFGECSDATILATQRLLATQEGIFCEPASAIAIAGLLNDIKMQKIVPGSKIVCTLTGHGLKDPDIAIQHCDPPRKVKANLNEIRQVIKI